MTLRFILTLIFSSLLATNVFADALKEKVEKSSLIVIAEFVEDRGCQAGCSDICNIISILKGKTGKKTVEISYTNPENVGRGVVKKEKSIIFLQRHRGAFIVYNSDNTQGIIFLTPRI